MLRPTALLLSLAALSACATPSPRAQAGAVVAVRASFEIGRSRQGRPILARRLGGEGRRIAVIANIHGDENEGLRHLEEVAALLDASNWRVLLIEDVNPDGTAAHTCTTSTGVDPNRNWPAANFTPGDGRGPAPLSEPGVAATHAALVEFEPEVVVVFHSSGRGPFVNFDGPAADLARAFSSAADRPWHVKPSMGYPTPGSLGTWMGIDRGVPILTIEFERGSGPEASGPAAIVGMRAVLSGAATTGQRVL